MFVIECMFLLKERKRQNCFSLSYNKKNYLLTGEKAFHYVMNHLRITRTFNQGLCGVYCGPITAEMWHSPRAGSCPSYCIRQVLMDDLGKTLLLP